MWRVHFQSDGHLSKLVETTVRSDCCFLTFRRVLFKLPIPAILIESRNYFCIFMGVYELVHSWKWVRIAYCYVVEFPAIDADSQSSIFSVRIPLVGPVPFKRVRYHASQTCYLSPIFRSLGLSVRHEMVLNIRGVYLTTLSRTCVLPRIYVLDVHFTCLQMV